MFGLDCGADGIAEVDLSVVLLRVGEDCAKFAFAFDLGQLFHVFHVFLVRFAVPEDHAEFHAIGFLVGEDQGSVGKVAPFVVWPHCRAIDCGSCGYCNSESSALPRNIVDSLSVRNP